jgi:hypothetical protein
VAPVDLIAFFTLAKADLAQVPVNAASYKRLRFALQLCTLRYLGFLPDDRPRYQLTWSDNLAKQDAPPCTAEKTCPG